MRCRWRREREQRSHIEDLLSLHGRRGWEEETQAYGAVSLLPTLRKVREGWGTRFANDSAQAPADSRCVLRLCAIPYWRIL